MPTKQIVRNGGRWPPDLPDWERLIENPLRDLTRGDLPTGVLVRSVSRVAKDDSHRDWARVRVDVIKDSNKRILATAPAKPKPYEGRRRVLLPEDEMAQKKGSKAIPGTHPRFGWSSGELKWRAPTEDEKRAMEIAAADPDARPWSGAEREAFLRDGTEPRKR